MPFCPLSQVPVSAAQDFGLKATRLAEGIGLGLSVPDAVVLDSGFIGRLLDGTLSEGDVDSTLRHAVQTLEGLPGIAQQGLRFGDHDRPLVLSVRSGGARGMAGVLTTVQGVGLNPRTVTGLGLLFGDTNAALSFYYRSLIQYGIHVRGLPQEAFSGFLRGQVHLKDRSLKSGIQRLRNLIAERSGAELPLDAIEQMKEVIHTVAQAWESETARDYRKRHGIDERPTTALILQKQVFGNFDRSFAAVVYSRSPRTGRGEISGGYIKGGTGDQVMTGGTVTPTPIKMLSMEFPRIADDLRTMMHTLEKGSRGPVEAEVVAESGVLHLLQWRPLLPASITVGLRIFLDMRNEGLITDEDVAAKIDREELFRSLERPSFKRTDDLGNRTIYLGKTYADGTARGGLIYDVNRLLERPPNRDWILVLSEPVDPRLLGELFRRTAGIVAMVFPGAHFFPRAKNEGIPVIFEVNDSGRVLDEGTWVSMDAMHRDGFVAEGLLEERRDREIARYVQGTLHRDNVAGDRTRELIGRIEDYQMTLDRVRTTRMSEAPGQVAARLLASQKLFIADIAQAVMEMGWAKRNSENATRHNEYVFAPPVSSLIEEMFRREPARLVRAFADTCIGQHSASTSLFRALPAELRGEFLNRFVRETRASGGEPAIGLFVLTRLIMSLPDNDMFQLLPQLDDEAIRFFVEDAARLYEAQVYDDISDRFPGVSSCFFKPLLTKTLSRETLDRLRADPELRIVHSHLPTGS